MAGEVPAPSSCPAIVLAWGGIAGMLRLVGSSMLEVLDSEYVKFARVKGVPERMVIYKHALKNAGIPALTYGGLVLASLLNGAVVVGGGLRLARYRPALARRRPTAGFRRYRGHGAGGRVRVHLGGPIR